jgi:glycosyltransferase involved in cell wall biosynthesis
VKRILWISEEVPDRTGHGGQRRQYHLIKALIGSGIRVDVAVPPTPQASESIRELTSVTVAPRPHRRVGILPSAFDRLIRSTQPDAVVVVHLVSTRLIPATYRRPPVPLFIDVQNVDSRWFRHLGDQREVRRAEHAERRALDRATLLVCSTEERDALAAIEPDPDIVIVRQGFDPTEWPVVPRRAASHPVVAFFGSLWYPINTDGLEWFIAGAWPVIRRERPDTQLWLFGPGPGERFDDPGSGVIAKGWVDDLAAALDQADVIIVPILAGPGSRVKFPETLASGVPVVATGVAAESFAADGHYVRADDPAQFAQACLRVIISPDEARLAASAARRYALAELTWEAAAKPLVDRMTETETATATDAPSP